MPSSQNHSKVDVAIIGAGVSGVYSGWRLLTADPSRSDTIKPLVDANGGKLNVQIFELSQRVGGRLLSITPPEMPDFKAEFGGMRFLNNQPVVTNLVDYLDLSARAFPVNDNENIYYLRGHHLRQDEFTDGDKVPYRLKWLEKNKTPGQLIYAAIDTILPGAERLSHVEWQDVKANYKFNGEHLYNLGFWNLLDQVMSSEAYKLVLDAGGYVTALNNWNAAEALEFYMSDFAPDAKYYTLNGGMETIPVTLARQFEAAGGIINHGKRLTHFFKEDGAESDRYMLYFSDGSTVEAAHIILAMPRRALELLAQDSPFFQNQTVRDLIPTVTPHPMFKLFLAYRYPWWRDAGVTTGRSINDLPLRQVYYFGSEPDPGRYEAEIMDSLLMASYDDGRYVDFWTGFVNDLQKPIEYGGDKSRWAHHQAPDAMVAHAQRQLKLVHDLEYLPDPYAAAFQYWGRDPFGGAWNSWNIRVKAWEVQEAMLQPLPDYNVYVVGEAYSGAQGWIEGALETAENMLQDKFDLRSPRWLP